MKMKTVLTLIYLFATSCGIIFMKLGGKSNFLLFKGFMELKFSYMTVTGFVFYLISFLLWQRLLVLYDLSYIVPITTGIIQIVILISSIFLFKENVDFSNLLGVLLIILGVVLISFKK